MIGPRRDIYDPELYTNTIPACPNCRSPQVFKLYDHAIVERIILYIVNLYPFLCDACHRRFYLFHPKSRIFRHESLRM
jgi:hypothetical protein